MTTPPATIATPPATGWRLEIASEGRIFVSHLSKPRFEVELIPQIGARSNGFTFKGQWQDPADNAIGWYLRAVEFYNLALAERDAAAGK